MGHDMNGRWPESSPGRWDRVGLSKVKEVSYILPYALLYYTILFLSYPILYFLYFTSCTNGATRIKMIH